MNWDIFLENLFSWQTCLLLAVACFGLNFHRRIREIQQQTNQAIDLLQKIETNTRRPT